MDYILILVPNVLQDFVAVFVAALIISSQQQLSQCSVVLASLVIVTIRHCNVTNVHRAKRVCHEFCWYRRIASV